MTPTLVTVSVDWLSTRGWDRTSEKSRAPRYLTLNLNTADLPDSVCMVSSAAPKSSINKSTH
jgi:hypothetical protein